MLYFVIYVSNVVIVTIEETSTSCYLYYMSLTISSFSTGLNNFIRYLDSSLMGIFFEDFCSCSYIKPDRFLIKCMLGLTLEN